MEKNIGIGMPGWTQTIFSGKEQIVGATRVRTLERLNQIRPLGIFQPEKDGFLIQESEILTSHFGIVPAVLSTEFIGRMLRYSPSEIHTKKRVFGAPLTPGTRVTLQEQSHNEKILHDKHGKIYAQLGDSQEFPDFYYTLPENDENIKKDGAEWVPHGKDFRFVDRVGIDDDMLIGSYILTQKYMDEGSKTIPFWLIEESCAQIMLGALRSKNGVSSDYGTYAQAETRGSENFELLLTGLKPGTKITCIGRNFPVENDLKGRKVRFEYCCYVGDSLFFRGNIQGNNIPKRIWGAMFKNQVIA